MVSGRAKGGGRPRGFIDDWNPQGKTKALLAEVAKPEFAVSGHV